MHSLRTYLEKLRETVPDQLVSVKEQVDWRYEVTARVAEMERERKNPALLFENVKDYSMPLLVNLFGHVDRIALGLKDAPYVDGSRLDFYDAWNGLFDQEVPPIRVGTGPVKDVILRNGDVDLASLPIPLFYREDGGRYVTAGLMAARNPDDPEEVNLSYVRMQLKGRDSFGVSFHSRGHMWRYLESSKALGEPMEVAVIIGAHPSLYLAAAAKITDEYHRAGALLGEAIEVVNCETVDVPVPAHAEIVLEGEIRLEEEDEGPFTEYTGYISGRSTRNLFKVSAITRREDAVFLAVAPSNSAEHLLISGLPKQARISRAMAEFTHAPALKDIIWPVWATHFACFISLREGMERSPGLAKQLGLLLLGLDHYVKIVTVLPAETDVSDMESVLGAIASRCDFRDGAGLEVLSDVFCQWLDPSSSQAGISSKMILDATGPEREATATEAYPERDSRIAGKIKGVSFPCEGNPHFSAVCVSPDMKDLSELLSVRSLERCRLIVCVDDDIDISDARQIVWAMATRYQPAEDSIVKGGRMVVDARKGDGWTARRATLPSR
ncbi:UbiD family decarboxylase [Candidatus Bathyarchaeota archaeon]|nr:UbiD family decarboxylase [Candidatus Bathyarchaeota archaeon]